MRQTAGQEGSALPFWTLLPTCKTPGPLYCLGFISGDCYLLQFLDYLYQAAMLQPPYCLTVVQPWCLS